MEWKSGIVVKFHVDVSETRESSFYHVKEYGETFLAEDIIVKACRNKGIGPRGFYFFGLLTEGADIWIPPNKEIQCLETQLEIFHFRIRFIPSIDGVRTLWAGNDYMNVLNYFFLQCRSDFVNDKIIFPKEIGQEHILGLGVVDMLRWGNEANMDLSDLKKEEPKKFIPQSAKKNFKFFFDSRRLRTNFNTKLDELSKNEVPVAEYKLRYISAFLKYAETYAEERFVIGGGSRLIVNAHLKSKTGSEIRVVNEKGVAKKICNISEVQYVNLEKSQEENSCKVILSRINAYAEAMFFHDETTAYSFISLVDGYYRLMEDFHYHICKEVYSPLLKNLQQWKCHGPVRNSWAKDRLLQKHKGQKDFNHLLKQKIDDFDCYILFCIIKSELKTLFIVKNEKQEWHFSFSEAPTFPSIEKLLQHYKQKKDPNILLNRYVPPTAPLDSTIYLCRENVRTEEEQKSKSSNENSQVCFITGISFKSNEDKVCGKFTTVRKHEWSKGISECQKVAVKTLEAKYSPEYLEHFMASMHRHAFWKAPTIVPIYAMCISPFQVVFEDSAAGNLEDFFYNEPFPDDVEVLLSIADEIAQALLYIHSTAKDQSQEKYSYHGNVRCRNVFVFHKNEKLHVKLGDPGLLPLYNTLSLEHPINEERLPWIAPELYSPKIQLKLNDSYSDIYSYGVFLFEVFSYGKRPFSNLNMRQLFNAVLFEHGLKPPDECPGPIAELMINCLDVDFQKRPSSKEIVRDLGKIINQPSSKSNPYNQAESYYSTQKVEDIQELQQTNKEAVIDEIFQQNESNQQKSSLGDVNIGNRNGDDVAHLTNNALNSMAISSETSSLQESFTFDSKTPLIPQSTSPVSLSHNGPAFMHDHSLNGGSLATSAETTTTLLSNMHSLEENGLERHNIQKRPLPSVPPVEELQHILSARRIEIFRKQMLGEGHYGEVYKGTYTLQSGEKQDVAIKSLKTKMVKNFGESFEQECKLMIKLMHPNIVQIVGVCYDLAEFDTLLVMEFIDKGSLRSYLQQNVKKLDEEQRIPLLLQFCLKICSGMIYLGSQNIVHRDLAARNVLISKDLHIKISDFGLARILEKDYYSMSDIHKEIPIFWCAPESIEKRKFSVKSDVWSYGVTIWEVYTFGKAPTLVKKSEYLHGVLVKGHRLPIPNHCPEEIYDTIMQKCWDLEPEDRLTFENIEHKLKDYEKKINTAVK